MMIKNTSVIVILSLLGIVAAYFYFSMQHVSDIESKGPEESISMAWIALATAFVSLLTSFTGLVLKIIELRENSNK